jgi:hypothetical protein
MQRKNWKSFKGGGKNMGHITYRQKKFVSISDRRIMPLALISDTAVWNERKTNHPAHWEVCIPGHILFTMPEIVEAKKAKYEVEAQLIERSGMCPRSAITPDTSLHSGDVYPYADLPTGKPVGFRV